MNFDGLSRFQANFGLTSALLYPRHMKCVRRHIVFVFTSICPFVRLSFRPSVFEFQIKDLQ